MASNGSLNGLKTRTRNAVGHRYLDILHSAGDTDASSTASTESSKDDGLDLLVLGFTTSTAMDEIDFSLCRFTQASPEAPLFLDLIKVGSTSFTRVPTDEQQHDSVLMPSKIRGQILEMLQADTAPPSMLSQMDAEIGHVFANATHIFCQRHDIVLDEIDLIGSGGQLVSLTSRPPKGQHRANMCLGEAAIICAKTGITTVSDFRTAEQAIGRQGAPLFAYMVGLLLHHPTRLQICITIGGITTVCFVPPDSEGGIDAMYDWDTGPGTVLLDAALRRLSIDPATYASTVSLQTGTPCQELINEVLSSITYLALRPPKTTAREIFSDALAFRIMKLCEARGLAIPDILATLTAITTQTIVQQLLAFGPGYDAINNADISIDGRGFSSFSSTPSHPAFLTALQAAFPGANFIPFDRTGVPTNAKKAVGFAMQAMEAILGRARPVSCNSVVRRPNTITGKIATGVRWREVMRRCLDFGGNGGWEGLPEVRDLRVVGRDDNSWMSDE